METNSDNVATGGGLRWLAVAAALFALALMAPALGDSAGRAEACGDNTRFSERLDGSLGFTCRVTGSGWFSLSGAASEAYVIDWRAQAGQRSFRGRFTAAAPAFFRSVNPDNRPDVAQALDRANSWTLSITARPKQTAGFGLVLHLDRPHKGASRRTIVVPN